MQLLYDFVESLGHERLGVEGQIVIFQSMPRKEYTEMDKTLGEAGLFPKALL